MVRTGRLVILAVALLLPAPHVGEAADAGVSGTVLKVLDRSAADADGKLVFVIKGDPGVAAGDSKDDGTDDVTFRSASTFRSHTSAFQVAHRATTRVLPLAPSQLESVS